MQILKSKKLVLALLAIAGGSYFVAYSSLDSNFLSSAGLVIVPLQVGACCYLLYLYWSGQIKGTSRYRSRQQDHDP